jgi:hypothetical protein
VSKDPSETTRPAITPLRLLLWAAPFAVSLLMVPLAFAMNWEPWFGYASAIAGALGSIMIAGQQLGIDGQ